MRGFWSLTLYNKLHLFSENDLKRYSLGTKNKNLVRIADGSLTIYVGPASPGKDKEANWLASPKEQSRRTSAQTGASRASSTGPGCRR